MNFRLSHSPLRTTRHGYTLIEVVLAGSLILLTISFMTDWTIRMKQMNHRLHRSLQNRQSMDRLASSLRSDSRESVRWEALSHRFTFDEETTVTYTENEGWLVRERWLKEQVKMRETFRIPEGYRLLWPENAEQGSMIRWRIEWSSNAPVDQRLHELDHWSIQTMIGREPPFRKSEPMRSVLSPENASL